MTRTAPEHTWAARALASEGTLSEADEQRVYRAYINGGEPLPRLPRETLGILTERAAVEKAAQDARDAAKPCPECGAVRPLSERRGLHCEPCWEPWITRFLAR